MLNYMVYAIKTLKLPDDAARIIIVPLKPTHLQHCSPNKSSGHSIPAVLEGRLDRELRADQKFQDFQGDLLDPGCQVCPVLGDLQSGKVRVQLFTLCLHKLLKKN